MRRGLDLFCGGGGVSAGFDDAGFAMYGIDNDPKMLAAYPYPFICMDAMEAMWLLLLEQGLTFSNGETLYLEDFAFIHGSPPCQSYSVMLNLPWLRDRYYSQLILPLRQLLTNSGLPYLIENVAGARFGAKGLVKRGLQEHGLKAGWLCGGMFGLPIYRHRYFETNWFWPQPGHPKHRRPRYDAMRKSTARANWDGNHPHPVNTAWREGHDGKRPALNLPTVDANYRPENARHSYVPRVLGVDYGLNAVLPGTQGLGKQGGWRVAAEAMQISWMKRHQLTQAVPPVMTAFLGAQLLRHLEAP